MRRVNESIRQVLSERLPELKDPRIGFVTVTGVVTAASSVPSASASRRCAGWTPHTASSRRRSRTS